MLSFYVGVHALIINAKNEILITKRSKHDNYFPSHWDLPGGSVDMGETVEEAMVREVNEEIGITITPIEPIFVYSDLTWVPDRQLTQIIYRCVYNGGSIVLDFNEHDEYQWVSYNDIRNFKCIAFLESLLEKYKLKY